MTDLPFNKTVLENGITVLTQSIGSVRSVAVGIFLEVGSGDETPETNGIAHFVEHMTFKGSARRSSFDIVQDIESRGGQINAYTSKDVTGYYARVLDTEVDSALDVLCDIVSGSKYPQSEIEKEKTVVREEIRDSLDTPQDFAHDRFYSQLFPNHPLGYPILGTEENVLSFKGSTLRDFIRQNYTCERMIVAATGAVNHDEFTANVRKHMGSYPFHGNHKKDEKAPMPVEKNRLDNKDIGQAHFITGRRSLSYRDQRRIPYVLVNSILSAGMTSRLFHNIREKYGFTYIIYSFIDSYINDGIFGIYVATDVKHVDDLNELIWKELNLLKYEKISRRELDKVKAQVKGALVMSVESTHHRLERMVQQHIRYGRVIPLDESLAKIDSVRPEDLQPVCDYLFDEKEFNNYCLKPSE